MATTTNNGWETPDDTDLVKDGALAIRDLGQEIDTSAGKTWLAWTAFTPTWTGLTVGNGVYNQSHYVLIGKTAHFGIDFTLGSTSAVTGDVTLILPANLSRKSANSTGVFYANFLDTGTSANVGVAYAATSGDVTRITVRTINVAGTYSTNTALSSTVPFTWAATDRISIAGTFEVA
jgi:hypothetical protein